MTVKVRYTLRVWVEKKLQTTKRVLINFNRDAGAIERKVRAMLQNVQSSGDEPKVFTLEKTIIAGNVDEVDDEMIAKIMAELKTGQDLFLANKDDSTAEDFEE